MEADSRLGNVSSKDIEYRIYSLGDVKVIELLLSLRYKYDDYLFMSDNAVDNLVGIAVSGTNRINEEMLLTYAVLDTYIESCGLSNQQKEMLRLVGEGYLNNEIARELDLNQSSIAGRLRTIYRKIVKENEWQWRKSVYTHELGLRTKRCSKCKEGLPGTVEFYRDDNRNKDGFQSRCKKCES